MQIDWLTVSAQIVNFLLLVYLLQRFLYRPVTEAMARRERRIAGRLEEAGSREREAEEERRRLADERERLERRREDILAEAKEEARQERERLLDRAREEVEAKRREWRRQVDDERETFLGDLRARIGEGVTAAARQALRDLADAELEARVIDVFLGRLEGLDEATRDALGQAGEPVAIASSFPLEPATRSRLTRAVHKHLAPDAEVEYRESRELLCGIELDAGGRRLGWSLADYLEQLGRRVEDALAGAAAGG
jgi:F-type H+-transporting ATPase subunit b